MSTNETYLNLFHDYIQSGLQQSLERVRVAEPLVSEPERQQAWHLLSYAFNVDAAWPVTRDLLLALAPKMEQAGLRDEWIPYLEQALHQSQVLGDSHTAAECQLHIGHLYRLRSQFDLARQWLTMSVEGFAAQGDKQGQARVLNQLAYVEYLQHHYAEASHFVERALGLLEIEDSECAVSYFVQGMIDIDHGRWHEAEYCHRQSLILREKQGDKRRIAWGLQNLAYALRGQEKFEEAIACYLQAATILDELHDALNWTHVQMNLGLAYMHSGRPRHALTYYTRTEQMYHKYYDQLNLAKLYTNLGLNYLALQEWSRSEQMFEASIKIYRELNDEAACLNAMDGLAMTYLAQGRYDRAGDVIEQALAALSMITTMPSYDYLLGSLTKHLQEARLGIASLAIPT